MIEPILVHPNVKELGYQSYNNITPLKKFEKENS
jgi:hypothetical protein